MRQKRFMWVALFGLLYVTMVAGGLWLFHQLLHSPPSSPAVATTAKVTRYGQHGGYVWEMQNRLRYLGFYNGKVDGIYGPKTLRAVKTFQSQFGLRKDGQVGAKTKKKLWLATRNWQGASGTSGKGFSTQDIEMMARAVQGEARGEPYVGKVAVAAVILNRVESERFPNSPSNVIFQPGAFTAVNDGQIWMSPEPSSYQAVRDALNGWDPTGGALYYFNPSTASSKWIWSRPQIKRIGKHIFTH